MKGRTLLDCLGAQRRPLRDIAQGDDRTRLEEIERNISALNLAVAHGSDDSNLRQRLGQARQQYQQLADGIHLTNPQASFARGEEPMRSAAEITALADQLGAACLEYHLGPSCAAVWTVYDGRISVHDIALDADDLARLGSELRRLLRPGRFSEERYKAVAGQLGKALLEPALEGVPEGTLLCLVPDGILHELPLHALLLEDRYVVQRHPVFYAPSLAVLSYVAGRTPSHRRRIFALGRPAFGPTKVATVRGEQFDDLPATEAEVKAIAALFGPEADVALGAGATEQRVRASISEARFLHFATHGLLQWDQPLFSGLLMSPHGTDDGILEAREIMTFDLDADLVVASACQTARGQLSDGEGILGLSRAFLMAGARSVVVSQWRVADESTARLMTEFYTKVREGQSLPEALRAAELSLIGSGGSLAEPFHWAPFILIGAPGTAPG